MGRSSAPMRGKEKTHRVSAVLRCVAAALVVLYHTDLQLWRLSDAAHIQSAGFGAAGTDMLFVISGFTMVYISHGKHLRFSDFMLRRVARIAPLYWLLTLCMLAAFLCAPSLFNNTTVEIKHFIASLAFVPATHPVLGIQRPFLVPGWALNIIAFFYLLFGLFLFLPSTAKNPCRGARPLRARHTPLAVPWSKPAIGFLRCAGCSRLRSRDGGRLDISGAGLGGHRDDQCRLDGERGGVRSGRVYAASAVARTAFSIGALPTRAFCSRFCSSRRSGDGGIRASLRRWVMRRSPRTCRICSRSRWSPKPSSSRGCFRSWVREERRSCSSRAR